jgi:hypothetical protein
MQQDFTLNQHDYSKEKNAPILKIRLVEVFEPSVAEPHHFYAAPGKNFDAAPAPAATAPAPAPTLLYSKAKFMK